MFDSLLFVIAVESTWLRTLPSFSTDDDVPVPVMTISPSLSGLETSTKSCVIAPPALSVTGVASDL